MKASWSFLLLAVALSLALANAHYTGPMNMTVYLSSANEVPAASGNGGTGQATVVIRMTDTAVCWEDLRVTPNISTFTAFHIHIGNSSVAGPVVSTLFTKYSPSGCSTNMTNRLAGTINDARDQYYINLHNVDYPNGVLRGQLGESIPLPLSGLASVPISDPNLTGSVSITVGEGYVCYHDLKASSAANITGGAIHLGTASNNGSAVIPLFTGAPMSSGCNAATKAWTDYILSNPGSFYVNLYTPAYPRGALRSQIELAFDRQISVLALPAGNASSGNSSLQLSFLYDKICYESASNTSDVGNPTALLIRQGDPNSNASNTVVTTPLTGPFTPPTCTTVDPGMIARILEIPNGFFLSYQTGTPGTERLRAILGKRFAVPLSAAKVVPPLAVVSAGASGEFGLTVGPNYVCWVPGFIRVNGTNRNVNLTNGEIYQGAVGANGQKVATLFDGVAGPSGCAAVANTTGILASPEQYYIVVSYNGAVVGRAQLSEGLPQSPAVVPTAVTNAQVIQLPMGAPAAAPSAGTPSAPGASPAGNSTAGASSGATLSVALMALAGALLTV